MWPPVFIPLCIFAVVVCRLNAETGMPLGEEETDELMRRLAWRERLAESRV
jgi:hypothetical protein